MPGEQLIGKATGHHARNAAPTQEAWTTKKGEAEDSPWFVQLSLESLYVLRLKALRAFAHVKLYSLTFLQAPKAVAPDSREVHENVFASLTADKAETLGIVKPFHCSLFHCLFPNCFLIFC